MLSLLISFFFYAFISLRMVHSIFEIGQSTIHFLLVLCVIVIGFFFSVRLVKECHHIFSKLKNHKVHLDKKDGITLIALMTGALLTFFLNHSIGIGAVLASSIVGLFAAWFIKDYALPIYCGSFVGMACNEIFSNILYVGLAAFISGVLFILSQHLFAAWGGKAGFMAFVGTYLTSILIRTPLRVIEPLEPQLYLPVFLFAIVGCLATFVLQSKGHMSVVSASALVGFAIALLYPDASHAVVVSAFCGTFAGMNVKENFGKKTDIVMIAFCTACLFLVSFALFDGSGGKLGALAFIATGATSGFKLFKETCIQKVIRPFLHSFKTSEGQTETEQR